jgi:hypothetical protein
MITPEAGISVPVDGSIGADLVGRITCLVEILTVLILDGCRVSRTICERDPNHAYGGGDDDRGHRPLAHATILS